MLKKTELTLDGHPGLEFKWEDAARGVGGYRRIYHAHGFSYQFNVFGTPWAELDELATIFFSRIKLNAPAGPPQAVTPPPKMELPKAETTPLGPGTAATVFRSVKLSPVELVAGGPFNAGDKIQLRYSLTSDIAIPLSTIEVEVWASPEVVESELRV